MVTGCTKVSPGCKNCYMYRQYPRLKMMGVSGYEHSPGVVSLHPGRLKQPERWRKPRRVFVNSMADTFHDMVPDHYLRWLFQAMLAAVDRGHTFQVLTKRPERALQFWQKYQQDFAGECGRPEWPAGIWIGTSVESQGYAEERVEPLLGIPAPVRFVSAEPLLGPLDLRKWLGDVLQWVIVGGGERPRGETNGGAVGAGSPAAVCTGWSRRVSQAARRPRGQAGRRPGRHRWAAVDGNAGGESVKAITLHEPWASLIASGHKNVETRSWKPPWAVIGQRIAVHAAKRRPKQWDLDLMQGLGRDELPDGYDFGFDGEPVPTLGVPLGLVLATVVLADAVEIYELKEDDSVDYLRGDVIAIGKSVVSGGLSGVQVDRYGDFTVGRWMWVLEDLQRLEVPVGAVGRQGFWEWEAPILISHLGPFYE